MIAVMLIFFVRGTAQIESKVLADSKESVLVFSKNELEAKYQLGLVAALNLAQNSYIIQALKTGDDLSGFRQTILQVKATKAPVYGIEVGKAGLVLRGLAPVMFDGEYLGSVEFIQGFDEIVNKLKSELGVEALIAMNASELSVATALNDSPRLLGGALVLA